MRGFFTIGRRGEELAERHCRRLGMRILARNLRTRTGEIDLVAEDGDTIVFIEVKTRQRPTIEAWEAVDERKRRRIAEAARAFLARNEALAARPCRFDLIVLGCRAGKLEVIAHLQNAWEID